MLSGGAMPLYTPTNSISDGKELGQIR